MNLRGSRDFTPAMYRVLLEALKEAGYRFQSFEEYCLNPARKAVILRHDVDRRPGNAMRFAEIESEMGIRGSYHFRSVSSSNVPRIISRIAGLGHEIAYHYEDMTTAGKMAGKDKDFPAEELAAIAFESFMSNLAYFRKYYPVRVISMHVAGMVMTSVRVLGLGGEIGPITGPTYPFAPLAVFAPPISTSPEIVFITAPAGVSP